MHQVEYQKLYQTTAAAELPFGWVFGVQLGLRQMEVSSLYLSHHHQCILDALAAWQCLALTGYWLCDKVLIRNIHLPKAALSIHQLISVQYDEVNRVLDDVGPDYTVLFHMYWDMMHILSQKEKSGLIFRYNALISEKSQNLRVEFKTVTIRQQNCHEKLLGRVNLGRRIWAVST